MRRLGNRAVRHLHSKINRCSALLHFVLEYREGHVARLYGSQSGGCCPDSRYDDVGCLIGFLQSVDCSESEFVTLGDNGVDAATASEPTRHHFGTL